MRFLPVHRTVQLRIFCLLILKQDRNSPVRVALQVAIIYAVTGDYLKDIPTDKIKEYEARLSEYIDTHAHEIIDSIEKDGVLTPDTEQALKNAINECVRSMIL